MVRYIDTVELSRSATAGVVAAGSASLLAFRRLCEGLPEQGDHPVDWSVGIGRGAAGGLLMTVTVATIVTLVCQRCLDPFPVAIDFTTRLRVVAAADFNDASRDHEEDWTAIECIAASRRLDVLELVEDEIILSLPVAPRHDACPARPADAASREHGPSAFAVLSRLKH